MSSQFVTYVGYSIKGIKAIVLGKCLYYVAIQTYIFIQANIRYLYKFIAKYLQVCCQSVINII